MIKKFGSLIILLVLGLVLTIFSSDFLTHQNLRLIATQTSVIAIMTLGQLLCIITGHINLSAGGTVALSVVVAAILMRETSLPLWMSIATLLLITSTVNFINGIVVTKFKVPAYIATLGMSGICYGAAKVITDGTPLANLPLELSWFFSGKTLGIQNSILFLVVFVILIQFILSKTKFGRYLFAVGSNSEATRLAGINRDGIVIAAYTACGFLIGVGALLLISRIKVAQPNAAVGYEGLLVASCVIGGASMRGGEGTAWGAVAGSFIMFVLTNGFVLLNINCFWEELFTGLILIIAVGADVYFKQREYSEKKLLKMAKEKAA